MDNSNANSASTATTRTEKTAESARPNSAPARLGRETEQKATKRDEPNEKREPCTPEKNFEQLMPSPECVGNHQKRRDLRTGGVPMERQYARRGEVGGRPETGGGSGTATREQNPQAADQRSMGGEAMVRGRGFLCRGTTNPGEVHRRSW